MVRAEGVISSLGSRVCQLQKELLGFLAQATPMADECTHHLKSDDCVEQEQRGVGNGSKHAAAPKLGP